MTDGRDGQTYPVVQIATSPWIAKNLNFDPSSTEGYQPYDSRCYLDSSSYCDVFGRLYRFTAKFDTSAAEGICMQGWHVSTWEEWRELRKFILDSTAVLESDFTRYITIPGLWADDAPSAFARTDPFGLNFLPGGQVDGQFQGITLYGNWWISDVATGRPMSISIFRGETLYGAFQESPSDSAYGYSVRCVRDK